MRKKLRKDPKEEPHKKRFTAQERLHRKLQIPFSLSLPYFAVAVILLTSSLFYFFNFAVGFYMHTSGHLTWGPFTLQHLDFYMGDTFGSVRWLYYIPARYLNRFFLPSIVSLIAGLFMLGFRTIRMRSFIERKMAER